MLIQVTCHRFYEQFITAMIVASCVALCFNTLDLDLSSTRGKAVTVLEAIFTSIFGIEVWKRLN